MVSVGVIGCGKIAKVRHIPEYLNNAQAVIAGYYDPTIERAEEQAAIHGGNVYRTIEAMLEDSTIDAVSVCLANVAHAEVTVQALKAGKHVLCEKPMAASLEECVQMAETARAQRRYLMIAHNQRLSQSHRLAKQLLDSGEIGRVLTFRTVFGHSGPENRGIHRDKPVWFFDKKQAVMGAMADLGIHKIDLMQYLLGQSVIKMIVCTAALDKKDSVGNPISVEDNALCILQMSEGAMGTMTASWTCYGQVENSAVIYGSEGILRIPDPWAECLFVRRKNGETARYETKEKRMGNGMINSGVIDEFISAIVEDRQPFISGEEALASMRAIFYAVAPE